MFIMAFIVLMIFIVHAAVFVKEAMTAGKLDFQMSTHNASKVACKIH